MGEEKDCMRLPVDADGVPIHIGDELELCSVIKGFKVVVSGVSEDKIFYASPIFTDTKIFVEYTASNFKHVKKDSWEQIIDDARKVDANGIAYKTEDLIERCRAMAIEEVDGKFGVCREDEN